MVLILVAVVTPPPCPQTHLVVVVRAQTPEEAVARGVRHMGGFSFIEPGQTVLLKPNVTGPLLPPEDVGPALGLIL